MQRVRLTISVSAKVIDAIDSIIDGVRIRNRSHAIETLLAEGLNILTLKTAVILAGGKEAGKRIPAIESALDLLKKNGINNVKIAVGYLGKQIKEHFSNGNSHGLNIEYIEGGQGTGGALIPLRNQLKSIFVVLNLVEPINCDLKGLIKFHNEQKPIATIATRSLKNPWGVYIFDPQIFNYLPKGFSMLEDEIFDKLIKEGRLISYPLIS